MSPATIGLCLGLFGLLDGTVQGLIFARVVRRIGLKRFFLTGLFCFIPLFATFPVINHFAREWGLSPAVWALVVLQLMIHCVTDMAFGGCPLLNFCRCHSRCPRRVYIGCAFLYITSSVESPRALGSVNVTEQMTASFELLAQRWQPHSPHTRYRTTGYADSEFMSPSSRYPYAVCPSRTNFQRKYGNINDETLCLA